MICPYCEVEITESAVEAEDGYCPECGVFLSANSVFKDDSEADDGILDDSELDEESDDSSDDYDLGDYEDIEEMNFDDDDFGDEKDDDY